MRRLGGIISALAIAALVGAQIFAPPITARADAAEDYPLGPDSQRQPGVPQGAITHYIWTSKIFPGTTRDYWVYVPAQYQAAKPACVMIFQDGEWFMQEDGRMRIPIVFDNLISKGEMPVTIGIFINPGVLKALSPEQQDRFNRSFEYDSLGDRYALFLLDEILPEVGKQFNLSKNPDDRAIAGLSSGGICAFNAAWNRPDAFRRVLSFIGSFADLRGGGIYPALIRKTEPKPLRVFLQDGSNDLNLFAGDWWLANQTMASALKWAAYDVKFVTGDKDHDMIQGGAILPDALRWLWRDYPQPIAKPAPNGTGERSIPILDPKSEWEVISNNNFLKAYAGGHTGNSAFRHGGDWYYTTHDKESALIYQNPAGKGRTVALEGVPHPMGLALSPDESLLYVTDSNLRWVWSYQVQADGSLRNGEPFYRLEILDESSSTGALGITVDTEGYVYVQTNLGIQVCDQPGRVVEIINSPGEGALQGIAFFGKDFDYLYADQGGKHYRRHLLRKGVPPGTVLKPPTPRL